MFALLSGLLAGSLHVLSGPDHVAAVLPLAARAPRAARTFGAVWGLGHGAGMSFWLALALSFRPAVPVLEVAGFAELLVGISLVGVGLWTLLDRCRVGHGERGYEHGAALGMGMLHGTAGAGHLLGVLPLLGLTTTGGLLYCAGFALAGIAAMSGVGSALGVVAGSKALATRARPICASLTLLVGSAWIFNALS